MLPLSKPARAVHGTEPLHSRSLVELGARKPPTRPKKFKLGWRMLWKVVVLLWSEVRV